MMRCELQKDQAFSLRKALWSRRQVPDLGGKGVGRSEV